MTAVDDPLLVARAVAVPRQFRLVGVIHSLAIATFLGFFVLIGMKLGADAIQGAAADGHLPFALGWSATATVLAFIALLVLHHRALIGLRSRTLYMVFPDRVEIRREGSTKPRRMIPMERIVDVQSWTGPLLSPLGLATLTLVEEESADPSGRRRHVFQPLPNVADPDVVADLIRSRMGGPKAS